MGLSSCESHRFGYGQRFDGCAVLNPSCALCQRSKKTKLEAVQSIILAGGRDGIGPSIAGPGSVKNHGVNSNDETKSRAPGARGADVVGDGWRSRCQEKDGPRQA